LKFRYALTVTQISQRPFAILGESPQVRRISNAENTMKALDTTTIHPLRTVVIAIEPGTEPVLTSLYTTTSAAKLVGIPFYDLLNLGYEFKPLRPIIHRGKPRFSERQIGQARKYLQDARNAEVRQNGRDPRNV